MKAVQASTFGRPAHPSHDPAMGAVDGRAPEDATNGTAVGNDEDMASEAGSEHRHRRHLFRRHRD
jgi:hypothetical protein